MKTYLGINLSPQKMTKMYKLFVFLNILFGVNLALG